MLQLILPKDMVVIALLKILSIFNLLKNSTLITAYILLRTIPSSPALQEMVSPS